MAPLTKTVFASAFGVAAATGAAGNNTIAFGSAVDLADPRVFSPYFYLYTNPDVLHAGITSPEAARDHWINNGISEGRQASGAFHVRQYLDRYPDLKSSFGNDFLAAVDHYLTNGISERRLGFVEGGAYGRYTIADQDLGLFVSASDRMGGAIDSLVWENQEFVNTRDHGREVQFAMSMDGHGECYNPTEAGSRNDGDTPGTSSVLAGVNSQNNVLQTTVLPAFWLGPGDRETLDVPGCSVSLATSKASNYRSSKAVSFRPFGVPRAIQFSLSITLPESVQSITIEGPTGYLTQVFSSYYTIDVNSGNLAGLSHDFGEQSAPVIFATPDGSLAMGAYSPPSQGQVGYGRFDFTNQGGGFLDKCHKWNAVFRPGAKPAGTTLSYTTYMCVGSLSDVQGCMVSVHAHAARAESIQV